MKVEWSERAHAQVNEIVRYKARLDPDKALSWMNKIYDLSYELERFPEMGRMIPELQNPALPELIFEREYRLVYRVTANEVQVLAVRHAHQNLEL